MRPTLNDIRERHDRARKERPVLSAGEKASILLGRIRGLRESIAAEDWRLGCNPERERESLRFELSICEDDLRRLCVAAE